MAINEITKIISLRSPITLFKKLHISGRNNKNIIFRNRKSRKFGNDSVFTAFSFWNIIVKKLKIPNPSEILLRKLKHELKCYLLDKQKTGCPLTWKVTNINLSQSMFITP